MSIRVIYFFITVIFFISGARAQNLSVIDSLRAQISRPDGVRLFEVLCALGFEYRYSYPDSTIYYCSQAYELGTRLQLSKGLSKPLSFMGLAYTNRGDYKESLKYHQQAIQIASAQNDSLQLGHSYNNLGRMFFDGGDLVRAFDNFLRAEEIFGVLHDKAGLAYVYRSMANVYKSQNDFKRAVEMSERAFQFRKELNDERGMISSLIEFGLLLESMGSPKEALEKFQQAEELATKLQDKVTLAELAMAMAEIEFAEKQYSQAMEDVQLVLNTVSKTTNQKLFIRAMLLRAHYLVEQKKYAETIPILEMVLSESRSAGNLAYELDALSLSADCHDNLGRIDRAQHYRNDFALQSEKMKNTDLLREIDRLQFQLSMEKMEAENKNLKSRQMNSESVIARQQFQNVILIIIVISFIVISTVLYLYNRKRKMVNEQLSLQNDKILQQQQAITETNEMLVRQNHQLSELNNEKDSLMSIVAHDLKSPLHRISGLARLIEMDGGLSAKQKEYVQLILNATKSGADLINDLLDVHYLNDHTHVATEANLDLRQLVEARVITHQESARLKHIEIDMAFDSPDYSFRSVPDYCQRIMDNLLSNAIKFSPNHSRIKVTASMNSREAVITVKDNGPGFTEEDKQYLFQKFRKLSARPTAGESSNGLGLAIVKTLVDRLNGKIELISQPGEGAEFVVTIPSA
jgi:signal transduction histidine kinase